jgi:hypothetical protein
MSTLADLTAQRRDLLDAAAENDGVVEESLEDLWERNDQELPEKIEGWGHYLNALEADVEVIDAEIRRLTERKRVRQNEYDRRRAFLMAQMESVGLDRVERPLLTVAIQNNPPAVRCYVSPEALPEAYRREIPARLEADKKALLAAYKAGAALPEGVYVERTRSLRIR